MYRVSHEQVNTLDFILLGLLFYNFKTECIFMYRVSYEQVNTLYMVSYGICLLLTHAIYNRGISCLQTFQ